MSAPGASGQGLEHHQQPLCEPDGPFAHPLWNSPYKLYIHRRSRWHKRLTSIFLWAVTLTHLGLFLGSLIKSEWTMASLSSNPLLGPGRDVLTQLGATATYKIQGNQEWWRIISSQFLCAGSLHVWAISSAAWTFGLFLSTVLAPWQLVLTFFLSGFAGVTMSANIAADFVTSAASGPVFGLMGGTCATLALHRNIFTHHLTSMAFMAAVLAVNLYMGATPFVDNSCNTIGFIAGALATLGCLLMNRRSTGDSRRRELMFQAASCLLFVLVLAISVVGVLLLLVPDKSPLQGCCNKWVCAPSPIWDCDAAKVRQICQFTSYPNGTQVMFCPRGAGSMVVPNGLSDSGKLSLCDQACSGAVSGNNNS